MAISFLILVKSISLLLAHGRLSGIRLRGNLSLVHFSDREAKQEDK